MKDLTLIVTKILKSKTLVVNWATVIASTITLWMATPVIAENPQATAVLVPILAGANIILRYLTDKPLKDK